MKTSVFLFSLMLSVATLGQQQLENPGFELWEDAGTVQDEPVDWSSIKTSDNSGLNGFAPQVWDQNTGAHLGSYCLKLENKTSFSIVATGTCTNGRVHSDLDPDLGYVFTDAGDARWNTTFTDRPDSLVGWYRFFPSGADHGKALAVLHSGAAKIPENGTGSNWIAQARFDFPAATISPWTRFSAPFVYYNGNTPSHILVVLNSGDSTIAIDGSTAYFDDLELIYNPSGVNEYGILEMEVYTDANQLTFDFGSDGSGTATVQLLDLAGSEAYNTNIPANGLQQVYTNMNPGVYLCRITTNLGEVTKKLYIR